jgi:hypothetical protein
MGRHHDVHSLLNPTWAYPEAELYVKKHALVRHDTGRGIQA